ncbi:hypothetical protein [Thalassoroseus pseudoceratinae]|uniref:hypothetical protein n=1 Tax=Thalassoroseus pseudoceratinae TaxID=2713176 RepID=UPI00141FAAFA|nr:hypothetical protein [Thalassoroseus pseudoceratinae]
MFAADAKKSRKKIAVVTTVWRERSHSWHMAERFMHGYPRQGGWHSPPIDVVSAFVDQVGDDDLSRDRAQRYGFKIFPTIADALRNGGEELAVDGVLVIGEHGDYPINKYGQKQYPRYEFFQEIAKVFQEDGKSVPVFNDKHLSWKFEWAKQMVATSKSLGFTLQGGSSLPVTWRMPAIDLPHGADVEEIMGVAYGPTDIYDFHALEMMQCMAERRRGGETGVAAVHALEGDAVWQAMAKGNWKSGGWDTKLWEACLSRSQTLRPPETFSHKLPNLDEIRAWVKEPVAYRIEYRDGTKATMLLMNGLVEDFTFAAKLKGSEQPISTLFHLPPTPNVVYSAGLMAHAETMFLTGKAVYPVERTLLTSGLVEACLQSLAKGQSRLATPHLDVRYRVPQDSYFLRR